MKDAYKSKTITLPEKLIKDSKKTFKDHSHKPHNKITFSEIVREALYCYNKHNGK